MNTDEQIKILNEEYQGWAEDKIFHQKRIKKCDREMDGLKKQISELSKT